MADKDFKTIEEQLEILRSRGLTISDESQAKDFLLRNNYYRISGYSLTLRKNIFPSSSSTYARLNGDVVIATPPFSEPKIIIFPIFSSPFRELSLYACPQPIPSRSPGTVPPGLL